MAYYHRHTRVRKTHCIDSTKTPCPIDQSTAKNSNINYMVNHFLKTGTVPPTTHRGDGRYVDHTVLPSSRSEALSILQKIKDINLRDLVEKWYKESEAKKAEQQTTTTNQTTTKTEEADASPPATSTKRTVGTPTDVDKP